MSILQQKPVLDPSSTLLLVTGASGHIASNIVEQALQLGYKVRGTARTQEKADTTVRVQSHENYHAVVVPDFSHSSPEIDQAVSDVTAICHVASDTTMSDDPKKVIDTVVGSIKALLTAASREKSVQRFVYTSSSTAALTPKPNIRQTATTDSWNDEIVDYAWNHRGESFGPNPYGFVVYAASKTEGEKAFWKFIKEEKPSFVANAVLPNFNMGRVLKGGSGGITGNAILSLYQEGKRLPLPPQYFINVVDDARIHLIAAVLDGDVQNERIFAFAETFSTNSVIDAVKRIRPEWKNAPDRDPNEGEDLSKVPNELGAKLLKKWYGQDGYQSLHSSLEQNLEYC